MNKFLKIFSLTIISILVATGLIYLGILFRVDESELQKTFVQNIEKNFPGSKLTIGSFENKLGLTVDFVLKDVLLKDKLNTELLSAKTFTLKVPLLSMLSAKGVNKIIVNNLKVETQSERWKKVLPASETAEKIISKINLPNFLVGNSVSLDIRSIVTSDLDPKVRIKKLNIKRMSLNKKSALELVSSVRLPLFDKDTLSGEFRYIGEFSLKNMIEKHQVSLGGTVFGQNLNFESSKIKLPNLKGSMDLIWQEGARFVVDFNVDLEGVLTGPVSFTMSESGRTLKTKLNMFPERILNFYRISSRFNQFDFSGIKIPILLNLMQEGDNPWSGVIETFTSGSIPWKFDGEEVYFDFKSFWKDQAFSIETIHQGFGGNIRNSIEIEGISLMKKSNPKISGEILLENISVTKNRIKKFLAMSSVLTKLDQAIGETPDFTIQLDSKDLKIDEKSSIIKGMFTSKYNQVIAKINAEFFIEEPGKKETLSFLSSRKLSDLPSLTRYDYNFSNLEAKTISSLFPFFLADLEGRLQGQIQYSEVSADSRIITDGIVQISSTKDSSVQSNLLSRVQEQCKSIGKDASDLETKSVQIKGTIDTNILFLNSLKGEISSGCQFKLSGSANLMSPSLTLQGVVKNKNEKTSLRIKGTSFSDFSLVVE